MDRVAARPRLGRDTGRILGLGATDRLPETDVETVLEVGSFAGFGFGFGFAAATAVKELAEDIFERS